MLCREIFYSSSGLLPVVSVCSRLWILLCGASTKRGLGEVGILANNNSTHCSSKANPSSFSSLAVSLLVHLLSPLSKGIGRE
jgi:hypothetical protein